MPRFPGTDLEVLAYIAIFMTGCCSAATENTTGTTTSVLVSNTYNVALPFSKTKQITIGTTAQRLIVR